jgi:hypothetical protein
MAQESSEQRNFPAPLGGILWAVGRLEIVRFYWFDSPTVAVPFALAAPTEAHNLSDMRP